MRFQALQGEVLISFRFAVTPHVFISTIAKWGNTACSQKNLIAQLISRLSLSEVMVQGRTSIGQLMKCGFKYFLRASWRLLELLIKDEELIIKVGEFIYVTWFFKSQTNLFSHLHWQINLHALQPPVYFVIKLLLYCLLSFTLLWATVRICLSLISFICN